VTASGLDAAKAVLRCKTEDLLIQKGPSPLFLQAEDTSQWPEHLRRKIGRGEVAREAEDKLLSEK
jgi:hypothetical protein